MRYLPIVACLLTLVVGRVEGQALDIGGIQVRLGQNVADALRPLSSYQTRYNDDAQLWLVTQRGESQYELLGTLSATDGRISGITKVYQLSNQYDAQRVYTQASRELHRLGGNACETREVELTDGQIHSIETRCGLYRLTYSFASTYQADNVGAGITISVSQR